MPIVIEYLQEQLNKAKMEAVRCYTDMEEAREKKEAQEELAKAIEERLAKLRGKA